nr:hypothetical protein [Nostoc sp. EkiNYC01]
MEFFPLAALHDHPNLHAFRNRWYVSHLLAMQERPLHPPATDQPDVYRLLFLPTFEQPSLIRLSNTEGMWKAVCKRTNGSGGYAPGQLIAEIELDLSPTDAKEFGRLLDCAEFWEMPSFENSGGLDGKQAVLEGVRAGRYHVVDRWSPRGTPYAKLVEFLLKLTLRSPSFLEDNQMAKQPNEKPEKLI